MSASINDSEILSTESGEFKFDGQEELFLLDKDTNRYGNGSSYSICEGVKNDIGSLLKMYGLKK